ncbi:ABC transporter ATP-binding protein [Leucobacter japonicus]|uniref:ABC transporter ATP-binding protein n=1 Tax=Leucobacter japonicus TaxID=1461259 RepID=UPI0006A7EB00|nr:ABC transporter ATP-binding protein [Leucobacter japonicus]
MTSHLLAAKDLTVGYDGDPVITGLDLALPESGITMIVGANGCGKSTLLRTLARLLKARSGAVLLDGEPIQRLHTKQVARIIGLLPQAPIAPDGITVSELVDRGRTPHREWLGRRNQHDDEVVAEALALTHMDAFADRSVDALSGGQRQRAWVAMALAQEPDILLLDEPTTYLDLAHQVELLELLVTLQRTRGTQIVVVMHELNLATRYADHLIAMRHGEILAEGAPNEIVNEQLIAEVFGLASVIVPDPIAGTPMVVPVGAPHPIDPEPQGAPAAPTDAPEGTA